MKDTSYIASTLAYLNQSTLISSILAMSLILAIAFIANFIVKRLLIKLLAKILKRTNYVKETDDMLRIVSRLANVVPAIVIMEGTLLVQIIPETLTTVIRNVGASFIVVTFALALNSLLDVINTLYMRRPGAYNKPIKGYLQVIKIIISIIACILATASLVDKSPLILLSGFGAMAAVTMLVFQDTILSLVASVQISSGNIVKLGDWIEMPQLNADGDVIDIALHTVKVQNWDKTITTIPTRKLVNESFKNWRGMVESGGRRIKRSISLDQNSIHFLSQDEEEHLKKLTLLKDYLAGKDKELEEWNAQRQNEDVLNARKLTNIGTFRAYVEQYLKKHPQIRQDMTLIVRQLAPGSTGLPLEIYCFTNTVAWAAYEGIQSDIFDHLYAILPEFGLHAFQQPDGRDLSHIQIIK